MSDRQVSTVLQFDHISTKTKSHSHTVIVIKILFSEPLSTLKKKKDGDLMINSCFSCQPRFTAPLQLWEAQKIKQVSVWAAVGELRSTALPYIQSLRAPGSMRMMPCSLHAGHHSSWHRREDLHAISNVRYDFRWRSLLKLFEFGPFSHRAYAENHVSTVQVMYHLEHQL